MKYWLSLHFKFISAIFTCKSESLSQSFWPVYYPVPGSVTDCADRASRVLALTDVFLIAFLVLFILAITNVADHLPIGLLPGVRLCGIAGLWFSISGGTVSKGQ